MAHEGFRISNADGKYAVLKDDDTEKGASWKRVIDSWDIEFNLGLFEDISDVMGINFFLIESVSQKFWIVYVLLCAV